MSNRQLIHPHRGGLESVERGGPTRGRGRGHLLTIDRPRHRPGGRGEVVEPVANRHDVLFGPLRFMTLPLMFVHPEGGLRPAWQLVTAVGHTNEDVTQLQMEVPIKIT